MPTYLRMGFSLGYFTSGCLSIPYPVIGFGFLLILAGLDAILSMAHNG